jgi:hypothetical protein
MILDADSRGNQSRSTDNPRMKGDDIAARCESFAAAVIALVSLPRFCGQEG